MHFDVRLEHRGVLLSWAVPRGPSLDPAHKRLAVQTEDHPLDYGEFEGIIPSGYGMGTVMLWDVGTFEWTRETATDVEASFRKGDIKFRVHGTKIAGEFALVRIGERGRRYGGSSEAEKNYLLIKKRDEAVVPGFEALDHDVSVKTGRSLEQIAADGGGDPRAARRAARHAVRPAPTPPTAPPPAESHLEWAPMLATPADQPFSRPGWLFELKYDGVRALAHLEGGRVRLVSRHQRDETARYPELTGLGAAVAARSAVLDGEIVAMDEHGRPSFERLQSRINLSRTADIRRAMREVAVTFVAFDVLAVDGRDLRGTDLRIRKKTLRDIIADHGSVLFADHVDTEGERLFEAVRGQGLEGIVAKRATSGYQSGVRSADWLKVKAWLTQSCVIIGYTAGRGRRSGNLGALVTAVSDGGRLVHCGQVGTGFSDRVVADLRSALDERLVPACPLRVAPMVADAVTWVRPELVCEVRHAGWTQAGVLRHPAFLGLRPELNPDDCRREIAVPTTTVIDRGRSADGVASSTGSESSITEALAVLRTMPAAGRWTVAGRTLSLTNLDKVLWPDDGLTKRDLIAYYVSMATVIIPYLRDRPLSLQVFPDGIAGKSFWRKDKPSHAPEWIRSWTYEGEDATKTYIVADEVATLGWVANAGVIDIHPWHSRVDSPHCPDWAVFDLDPFPPATFADVVDVALLVKAALDHYGLQGQIKTTGQTGLQVYVAIERGPDYSQVRSWVEEVARAIGQTRPDIISWEWAVARRAGRIRIDYTQNIINKTLAAPYSLRPHAGAPVSAPIGWDELRRPDLRPDGWNIRTIGARLEAVGDLFAGVLDVHQRLPSR